MTTITVQIPSGQVGWFEQMVRAMGWPFKKEEATDIVDCSREFGTEVDGLLSAFCTDQITQEEINSECELVREELYHERKLR